MRIIKCDVCGSEFERGTTLEDLFTPDDPMIRMQIPGEFLGHDDANDIVVDVCGWPCVNTMVDGALNAVDEGEEVPAPPEEKPQSFVAIPKTPTIDTNMDEKTLARFTEQVTGVKRR
jgi:hypothetical protein